MHWSVPHRPMKAELLVSACLWLASFKKPTMRPFFRCTILGWWVTMLSAACSGRLTFIFQLRTMKRTEGLSSKG